MTYLECLNDFNQWLETNALPASSQLMFYKLLYVFNRAGWPEYVGVDNLRLMLMTDTKSEKTVIRARDKLVEAGFITYKKGRKGMPNQYFLCNKHCKNYSINGSENNIDCNIYSISASISDSVSASISDSENDSHIKTKTKTKKDPPLTPPDGGWGFGDELTAAFSDWLAYKREKRQDYKPTGLKSLVTQARKYAAQYGEQAVADLIRVCMASNWQGIIFDRLSKPSSVPKAPSPMPCAPGEADRRSREDMESLRQMMKHWKGELEDA